MPRARSLPAPRTRFVGRQPELDGLHALLARSRLVSIVGPGGCGKTRLALELVADRRGSVTLVELASLGRTDDVAGAFLEQVGAREDPLRRPIDQLVEVLASAHGSVGPRPAPVLLVDNAEHVLDPVAALVDQLLTEVDDLTVAVTTREPLGVVGEAVYRVPPMSLPDADADADAIRSCDAVALFLDRAAFVRPETPGQDTDLAAVAEICRRLDGLPLAIELAAARLPLLAPDRIVVALDDRFRLLVTGNRTALPRQRTLEGCVDWSYSLLSVDEQRLLDRLSVFRGWFTAAGVAAVATSVVAADLVFEMLDRLVAKSLVIAEPRPEGTRFRLLETIAAYAATRLEADSGGEEALNRLAEHVDELTEPCDHELTGPEQDRLLDRLRDDEDTIRVALDHLQARAAADPDAAARAWRIIGRLTFFWLSAGRFREARARFGAVADHPPPDPRSALPARWGAAHLATYAGDFEQAVVDALDVLADSEELGDDRHAARALDTLACMELFVDPAQSLTTLDRAIELADRAGDRWCGADSRQVLAYVQLIRHELDAAEVALDESIGVARSLDHPLLLAWDGLGRAMVAFERGQPVALAARAETARQVARTEDPNLSAQLVGTEALVAFQRGGVRSWIERLERSAIEGRRSEAGLSFPTTVVILLLLLVDAGELRRAEEVIDEHVGALVATAPAFAERLLSLAARAALAGGDHALAARRVEAAEAAAASASRGGQALVALVTAAVALLGGDLGTAESRAAGALESLVGLGLRPAVIDAIELLALVHHERDPVAARRLVAAARGERGRLGIARTELQIVTGPLLARALDPTGDASPDDVEPVTLDDVVAWVRRSRGERRRPSMGWASLTPTELQVAELVASGCTNAQAAERLFVSAATVKTHLAHIFRKLDIANRAALTAAFLAHARP